MLGRFHLSPPGSANLWRCQSSTEGVQDVIQWMCTVILLCSTVKGFLEDIWRSNWEIVTNVAGELLLKVADWRIENRQHSGEKRIALPWVITTTNDCLSRPRSSHWFHAFVQDSPLMQIYSMYLTQMCWVGELRSPYWLPKRRWTVKASDETPEGLLHTWHQDVNSRFFKSPAGASMFV